MLTNFFSKSKPFNYILVSLYLIGGCIFWLLYNTNFEISVGNISRISGYILGFLFLLFLLNFIIRKNKLTKINTYPILIFSAFLLMYPIVLEEVNVVVSAAFILLSLRRILSLSSDKNTKKKILDASLWISIAAFFYFWSLLFFVVLFVAIINKASKNYKLFFIPFVGFLAVFTLITVYYLLMEDVLLWFLNSNYQIGFDFSVYKNVKIIIPTVFLLLSLIVSVLNRNFNSLTISLKEKSKFNLLLFSLFVGLSIIIITPQKNGSELIFLFAPLAIFVTYLIETVSKKWVSELLLTLMILLPFVIPFL